MLRGKAMVWILLHNNDDQGREATTRARRVKLEFIEVVLPGPAAEPSTNYAMLNAFQSAIQQNNYHGVIYSGHGANSGSVFLSSSGKELNTDHFATLLGLAQPTRVIVFSCYGGKIVENNLQQFGAVNNISVPLVNNAVASLDGTSIEGPKSKIEGMTIEAGMRSLVNNAMAEIYTTKRGDFNTVLGRL
ncbi:MULTISPECIES: hypothetical protein [unclassified Microcoleus]|uniref:hypothetical protein n=2 Tax=Microcoleus TaxID=44471 RepID=UPI002FD04423